MNTVKRHGISHALIEVCFIDDADDMKLYLVKKEQAAQAIAEGITEGFGLTKKTKNTSVATFDKPEQMPDKPEQTPDLKEQFDGLYNVVNPLYTILTQIPYYWKEDVAAMIKSGVIKGDGKNEIAI